MECVRCVAAATARSARRDGGVDPICDDCLADELEAGAKRSARDVRKVTRSQDPSTIARRPMLVTVAEAAERLAVSKETVYRPVRRGQLQGTKVGAALRISSQSLAAYMGVES